MSRVEVPPFSKFVWRTPEIEKKWEPLRRRIYGAVSYTEYETVRRGFRRCDVYDFGPDNIMNRLKKPALDGLVFLPILISETYGGYGHRHYLTPKFGDRTFIYGVVSTSLDDAIKFHDAGVPDVKQRIRPWPETEMNPNGIDHNVTGALLGYPACDRKFFQNTWLRDGCLDPMYEMAKNTVGAEVRGSTVKVSGYPHLNRLARYWGFNIIPHFPHSFDCRFAKEFADQWFSIMREYDAEAADACLEVLSQPMVWSMTNAVTTLEHPLFFGSANGYYRPESVRVEWFPK